MSNDLRVLGRASPEEVAAIVVALAAVQVAAGETEPGYEQWRRDRIDAQRCSTTDGGR